jgi:hypothetical protein
VIKLSGNYRQHRHRHCYKYNTHTHSHTYTHTHAHTHTHTHTHKHTQRTSRLKSIKSCIHHPRAHTHTHTHTRTHTHTHAHTHIHSHTHTYSLSFFLSLLTSRFGSIKGCRSIIRGPNSPFAFFSHPTLSHWVNSGATILVPRCNSVVTVLSQ